MANASLQHHPGGKWQRWSTRAFLGVWAVGVVVLGLAFLVQAIAAGSLFAVVLGLVVMGMFAFGGLRAWRSAGVDIPTMPWLRSWRAREYGGVTHTGLPLDEHRRRVESGSASTPGPFGEQRRQPQTKWYWIAGLFIAAGVAGAAFGIGGLITGVNDLERVPFSSGGTVDLDGTGGYVVYAMGTDVSVPDDMRVSVVGPDGQQIPTEPYGFSLTIDVFGDGLTTVATFDAPAPGTYRIAAVDTGPAVAEEVAVGRSVAGGFAWMMVGGAGVAIGIAVIIVTRRSVRRRRQATG